MINVKGVLFYIMKKLIIFASVVALCSGYLFLTGATRAGARGRFIKGSAAPAEVAATRVAAIVSGTPLTAHDWYFKTNKEHRQPEIFDNNKMPDKYDTLYLGSPDDQVVYLTFDAGYENGNVGKILDILKAHSAPSAFFILPTIAKRNPEIVKRMAEEGHLVCNHSTTHKNMAGIADYDEFLAELTGLETAVAKHAGVSMAKYFRPPEGIFSERMLEYCQKAGYAPVFWSFAYADWDNNAQKNPDWAFEKIMANVHNGMVLLLHPNSATNTAILGRVLDALEKAGFRYGTLDELCAYVQSKNGAKP